MSIKRFAPYLISFIAILGALGLLEIAVRVLEKAPKRVVRSDRPHKYFFDEHGANNRDYFYPEKKSANTFRIVVIGDSFTFGFGVPFDDSFPKRFERLLNLNISQPKVEVINKGVPGLSTKQEVKVLKRALDGLSPDLVLLQVTLNDPELRPFAAPHGALMNNAGSYMYKEGIFKYWRTLGFVWARIQNTRSYTKYIEYFQKLWTDPETVSSFEGAVATIKRLTEEKKVPVIGMVFPLLSFSLDDTYPFKEAHRVANQILHKYGIHTLDLFQTFHGMDTQRLQASPGLDPHPSEIAHRVAAEALLQWIQHRHLLPEETYPKLSARKRVAPKRLKIKADITIQK